VHQKKSYDSFLASPYRSIKRSNYFDIYDELFSEHIGKNITFVEIGILNGGSLFMWRDFFGPTARIIGVDINPETKFLEKFGFEIFIGSQYDLEFLKTLKNKIGKVHVILDDAGHTYLGQISAMENLLDCVVSGGVYVVEDTHTSFERGFGSPKFSFVEYAKRIIDRLHMNENFVSKRVEENYVYSVQVFNSLLAFKIKSKREYIDPVTVPNLGKNPGVSDFRLIEYTKTGNLTKRIASRFLRKLFNQSKILRILYFHNLIKFRTGKELKKYFKRRN